MSLLGFIGDWMRGYTRYYYEDSTLQKAISLFQLSLASDISLAGGMGP